jgi:hypothetical protein
MDKDTVEKLINDAYSHIDGYAISHQGQIKLGYSFLGYEYGEALFESFYAILTKSHPQSGEVFYDLGSGLGKKLLIAALGFPFKKAIGIEIIPDLHQTAEKIISSRFNSHIVRNNSSVELINANFLEQTLTNGDVYYVSIDPYFLHIYLQNQLHKLFEATKIGTRVITSNVSIPSSYFSLEAIQKSNYSAGQGTMYLHKKIK